VTMKPSVDEIYFTQINHNGVSMVPYIPYAC